MKNSQKLIFLPLSLLSIMAIIHNAYLSKETASLHTGSTFLDWFLAVVFAVGIESGLWALIIYRKTKAVQAYAVTLFSLNLLYYGRDGKLNQIVNLMHPEAWLYVEGILTALIFSALLSGFAWFLTEIAIEHLGKTIVEPVTDNTTTVVEAPSLIVAKQWAAPIIQADQQHNVSDQTTSEESVTVETTRSIHLDSRVCPNCNNEFTAKRKDAIYCSPSCKQHNYRKGLKQAVA